MTILYLLIPLGLLLLGAAVWAFFWAVAAGQFDDLDTPAMSVVMDDDAAPPEARADTGTEEPAREPR
ncbi:MAG TPA: cbb3-type cytochrome oxidase assembly protein CcoS [Woeseiaceae bacterium]|nr:cbb3-type cytochrome oxidase assembly protein CcoS [Woeseiaceae bacterium]